MTVYFSENHLVMADHLFGTGHGFGESGPYFNAAGCEVLNMVAHLEEGAAANAAVLLKSNCMPATAAVPDDSDPVFRMFSTPWATTRSQKAPASLLTLCRLPGVFRRLLTIGQRQQPMQTTRNRLLYRFGHGLCQRQALGKDGSDHGWNCSQWTIRSHLSGPAFYG